MNSYIIYYNNLINQDKNNNNELILIKNNLEIARNYIFNAGLVILIIGFFYYLFKQYYDHKTKFNLITFFFGKNICDSLNK